MCTKWVEQAYKLMTVIEGDFSLICHFFFLTWRIHVCPSICAIIEFIIILKCRTSLVIQWLRLCLPVQVIGVCPQWGS